VKFASSTSPQKPPATYTRVNDFGPHTDSIFRGRLIREYIRYLPGEMLGALQLFNNTVLYDGHYWSFKGIFNMLQNSDVSASIYLAISHLNLFSFP